MTRQETMAEIEAAIRLTEEALRRGDPDTLAGRFEPLKPEPAIADKTQSNAKPATRSTIRPAK